jgi:hypothetical protein
MYLKITSPGTCHPEAFTILGVSTARGKANKIGQFGSGAKMGINTCLRHSIAPVIVSGDMVVKFDCVERSMGDRKFDQVLAIINGEKKELGFALEFGAIDWTKIDYALREFVSNAYDQGGCLLSVVPQICEKSPESTSVYVEYTDEVRAYHENINKYFLPKEDIKNVMTNNSDEIRVYRKGVMVHCTVGKALFSYNIDDISIDESRNADTYVVKYHCAKSLRNMNERQGLAFVKALVDNEPYFEVKELQAYADYMGGVLFNSVVRDAFEQTYGNAEITTPDLIGFCKNKYGKVIAVVGSAYKLLSAAGVRVAEVEGGRTGAENGFMPIDTTGDCRRVFNRVWGKIVKLGLHNGKDMPELAMFSKPMSCGSTVNGYYESGTVYISRDAVNAKVILEEIGHYVTDANDCTRDFQDWAFNVAGALL